ncbi:hypothetical protein AMATHDRAFT_76430 [Amanita thiersii Skay4041]|uniref:EF-hand domain-containing protein n=1 Tax=Amanita thiersii Skay4041 TaxID=703135 RepID=A0A2A9NI52_9AGAR|nr:hypothetical protein AMATHDRAFT_76430 [Amanita thiersii Skay4041]
MLEGAKDSDDAHTSQLKLVYEFYDANAHTITPRSRDLANPNIDVKKIEDVLSGFADTAKVIVKGLTALGQIHPFIGVAVGAFALVIALDFTRRDNDRKVLAIKIQMQDLMAAFFDLRHIRRPSDKGPDGLSIAERLESLMVQIAHDIKQCGSACDAYMKKSFLAKTVKASVYETRLGEFATLFKEHRKSLELALSVHAAIAADDAREKLTHQGEQLKSIEEKLDMMLVFRRLDTPREKEVAKFLQEHGGVRACIGNDELLEELVTKSGEAHSRISGREGSGRRQNDLLDVRKKLMKELQEDIDEAFSRNMVLFERKLDIQSKQIEDTVHQESEHIINTLLSGAHDRITDPDLQRIWKDMGWKSSVKARHFVFALHDYYTDQVNPRSASLANRLSMASLPTPPSSASPSRLQYKWQNDQWALAYINAAYVQPILEAIDDDGTGYISVNEVNAFVSERPEGWDLPHWIAYWAVGWQVSISKYKSKIYGIVQEMFDILQYVLPSNRRAVDEYLFHTSFWRIELLLRSTHSANSSVLSDPDLSKVTQSFAQSEEDRIKANLEEVGYELDSPATVTLITGVGRIERFVYPLMYLLFKRHLKIIKLACKHVVHTDEFISLNESLVSVLLTIDYRVRALEAIFKQTHLDVQARLGNFAFGILQLSYGDIKRSPTLNTFGSWIEEDHDGVSRLQRPALEDIKASINDSSLSVLKYGIQDGYYTMNYYEFEPDRVRSSVSAIQGTWTGHCERTDGNEEYSYLIRLSIRFANDHEFVGKGEEHSDAFQLTGALDGMIYDGDGSVRNYIGHLDVASEVITITWKHTKKDSEDEGSWRDQSFTLQRTPPALVRYRYTDRQFSEDPAGSRWSFACAASLHLAQAKIWSRRFFEARFQERKRFVELSTRSSIVKMGLTPQNPLNVTEKRELDYLRRNLDPSEARFYQAMAEFEIQKLPWHPAWGCDSCERRITKSRILCIQCMAEDLSDNIDLCGVCLDKAPTKRGFVHDVAHHFSQLVLSTKEMLNRFKNFFRPAERLRARSGSQTNYDTPDDKDLRCICCLNNVSLPCWVCLCCADPFFICPECDSQRRPPLRDGPAPGHNLNHALLRIPVGSLGGDPITIDERLLALENMVYSLESRLTESLAALEAKTEERIQSLEQKVEKRLESLEMNLNNRFAALEDLIMRIAGQTSALPTVYGHLIRDSGRRSVLDR